MVVTNRPFLPKRAKEKAALGIRRIAVNSQSNECVRIRVIHIKLRIAAMIRASLFNLRRPILKVKNPSGMKILIPEVNLSIPIKRPKTPIIM